MSLLFDAHLSPALPQIPANEFPGSRPVGDLSLSASDRAIWEFAIQNGLVVVTKDADFENLALLYAPPGKVIRLRMGNCRTSDVATCLISAPSEIMDFISAQDESLLLIP